MGCRVRVKRTNSHAEPVAVVGSVRVGSGEVDELGRFDLLVELVPAFLAVDLHALSFFLHFPQSEKEKGA